MGRSLSFWAVAAALAACAPAAFAQDHAAEAPAELEGVVSWKTLAQVEQVRLKERVVPKFAAAVSALDASEVRLQGFMMPLGMGEQQSHFVLMSVSPSCSFCMTGGPESMVEVRTKTPIRFTVNPVLVSGRFAVLADDPRGVYYRLTDAAAVAK